MVDWSKVGQRAWQHGDVNFDSKSGLHPTSFLGQITYVFEVQEVRNPTLQTIHNSKLKQGRYNQLK